MTLKSSEDYNLKMPIYSAKAWKDYIIIGSESMNFVRNGKIEYTNGYHSGSIRGLHVEEN